MIRKGIIGGSMGRSFVLRALGFLSAILISSSVASAQSGEYTFSGGYSHLYTGSNSNLFYDRDGGYVDADFAWHVPQYSSPIMLGVGITGAGYWASQNYVWLGASPDVIVGGQGPNYNPYLTARLDSRLYNFEIEPRLAFEYWIPRTNIFIKPRIGAGVLIDNYSINESYQASLSQGPPGETANHTGAAFEIHPEFVAGVALGRFTFGMDVSYMAAWGGFGGFGDHAEELRAGAFVGFRF